MDHDYGAVDYTQCPFLYLLCVCMLSCFSRVQLFGTPETVAHQAPLSMGFSRQEYWSGCHSLLQGIFSTQGSNPSLLYCRQISLPLSHQKFGEGNGTPLQYSCLENPMDGGAWWATVHGVAKSRTRPSDFTFTFRFHALEKEMATHSSILP